MKGLIVRVLMTCALCSLFFYVGYYRGKLHGYQAGKKTGYEGGEIDGYNRGYQDGMNAVTCALPQEAK